MKRKRRRKCKHCGGFYQPDHRNRDRQRYCCAPTCQRHSHAASQRQWLAKPANRDYFRGPEHRERMRRWRREHPHHKHRPRLVTGGVNDDCPSQPIAPQADQLELAGLALQDDCRLQLPFIVGLISNLTGHTLQDDIARSLRQYHSRGQQILGGAPITPSGDRSPESVTRGDRDVVQTTIVSGPTPAGAASVQLD